MKRIIYLFLLLAVIVSMFSSCSTKVPSDMLELDLYFANATKDSLVTENAYINKQKRENTTEFIKEIMSGLFRGPVTEGYTSVIPEGVKLRGVSLDKNEAGTVNIDLSEEYYTGRDSDALPSEELLARYSIISTLCQFEEIKKVKIFVDGKTMTETSGEGEALSAMGSGSVMINSPSSVETKTEKFVTLYFTDKNGKNLYPEIRKATMTDNSLEKTVVNELVRGPVSNSLERTFSDTAQLISVETTENVCFVNFSEGFLSKIEQDATGEKIAVYSVVNSLTRLPEIEKVQILIDGKKPEYDVYQLFSVPLERDESIIINNK